MAIDIQVFAHWRTVYTRILIFDQLYFFILFLASQRDTKLQP